MSVVKGFLKGGAVALAPFVVAGTISTDAEAGIGRRASKTIEPPKQEEIFEPNAHFHRYVCDKTGFRVLKIGIDFTVSTSDTDRMGTSPEVFTKKYAPAFSKALDLAWQNAAKKYEFNMSDINNLNSPLSKAANEHVQEVLDWVESDSGVTILSAGVVEGFVLGNKGLSCR